MGLQKHKGEDVDLQEDDYVLNCSLQTAVQFDRVRLNCSPVWSLQTAFSDY